MADERVVVRVYDLTRGMATALAPAIIGREVEGIWHSGVVVFGREFFFGGGVQSVPAEDFASMYAVQASRELDMGMTAVPRDVFDEWLQAQGAPDGRFGPTTYNITQRNCNHFADEAVQFLTGAQLPDNITSQANELMGVLLQSPMGNAVLPLLQGVTGPLGSLVPSTALDQTPIPGEPLTMGVGPSASAQEVPRGDVAVAGTRPTPTSGTGAVLSSGTGAAPQLQAAAPRATPLLSLQGDPETAVPKIMSASRSLADGLALSKEECTAVEVGLPALAQRPVGATVDGGAAFLGAEEKACLAALSRAAGEWPPARLGSVAFAVRRLVLLPPAQLALRDCVTALAQRMVAADASLPATARMMAMAAVANAVGASNPAAPDARARAQATAPFAADLLDEVEVARPLVDGALAFLKEDDSAEPARLLAAALLYNVTLHKSAHADEETSTTLLCAVVDELLMSRGSADLADRLARALAQLLSRGGEEKRDLAVALGIGVDAPAIAALQDEALKGELTRLLAPR